MANVTLEPQVGKSKLFLVVLTLLLSAQVAESRERDGACKSVRGNPEHRKEFIDYAKTIAGKVKCDSTAQEQGPLRLPPDRTGMDGSEKNKCGAQFQKSSLTLTPELREKLGLNGPNPLTFHHYKSADNPGRKTIIRLCGWNAPCVEQSPGNEIPKGYDVVFFDYPGQGQNKNSLNSPSAENAESAAKVVQSVIEQLDLKNYAIYGYSYGTQAATIAASRMKVAANSARLVLDSPVASNQNTSSLYENAQRTAAGLIPANVWDSIMQKLDSQPLYKDIFIACLLAMNNPQKREHLGENPSEAKTMACLVEHSGCADQAQQSELDLEKFATSAICNYNYDPSAHNTDHIPTTFIANIEDPITPFKSTVANCLSRAPASVKNFVTLLEKGHAQFGTGQRTRICEEANAVWEGIFQNESIRPVGTMRISNRCPNQTGSAPANESRRTSSAR